MNHKTWKCWSIARISFTYLTRMARDVCINPDLMVRNDHQASPWIKQYCSMLAIKDYTTLSRLCCSIITHSAALSHRKTLKVGAESSRIVIQLCCIGPIPASFIPQFLGLIGCPDLSRFDDFDIFLHSRLLKGIPDYQINIKLIFGAKNVGLFFLDDIVINGPVIVHKCWNNGKIMILWSTVCR